jgi:hypothetical protein
MSLATVDDYETLTGTDVPAGAETDRVQALLDVASAAVQGATGQTIEKARTVETFCLEQLSPVILLDEVPLIEASPDDELVVEHEGEVVPRDHYSVDLSTSTLKHCDCHPWWVGEYAVTYTHGRDPVPPDLVGLVVGAVHSVIAAPAGVASQSVGSYSVAYREGADVAGLGSLGGATVDRYAMPSRT